jgi:hypothetical protein
MAEIKQTESGSMFTFGGIPIDGLSGKVAKPEVNPNALYAVNWSSLQKVEDLILVLASLGFAFNPQHPHFQTIKHLLDLENPIIPPSGPQNS